MKLLPNWKFIATRAWSVRFTILSGVFSASEVIVPMFATAMPPGIFIAAALFCSVAAAVSRVVAQPETLPRD